MFSSRKMAQAGSYSVACVPADDLKIMQYSGMLLLRAGMGAGYMYMGIDFASLLSHHQNTVGVYGRRCAD